MLLTYPVIHTVLRCTVDYYPKIPAHTGQRLFVHILHFTLLCQSCAKETSEGRKKNIDILQETFKQHNAGMCSMGLNFSPCTRLVFPTHSYKVTGRGRYVTVVLIKQSIMGAASRHLDFAL